MYSLVVFGCYSLATIGNNLMKVRDCPEASEELNKEIAMAKKELAAKGIKLN